MSPLCVPNFSLSGTCIHVLWWNLQSVQKEEKKTKEKTPNFGHLYLGHGWCDFLEMLNLGSPTSPEFL